MTEHRPARLAWAPPFLVGMSAAIAAEVGLGVLLYEGPGFVRSLTVVLAAGGLSLAGGLWAAPRSGPDTIDRLRRRWLFCLFAFLAAAAFGVVWSVPGILEEGRGTQALGLAILTALPLFACGTVLGGIAAIAAGRLGGLRVGAAATFGAALGFVVTGVLLPRTPLPASLLLVCLVLLSLGGMVFGGVLGTLMEIHVREERPSALGVVRVEDRLSGMDGVATRVLLEGEHERCSVAAGEGEVVPWDVAVARTMMPAPEMPWSVLAVGGGASTLARSVLVAHPAGAVHVLERCEAVVDLGREHLETELRVGESERVRVQVGNLEDLLRSVRERYDLVLVDEAALAPLGGASGLSREARGRIVQAVAGEGALVWGPCAPMGGAPELAAEWARASYDRYSAGAAEAVLLMSRGGADRIPDAIDGFVMVDGGAPGP